MTQSVIHQLQSLLAPPIPVEVLPQASFGRKDGLIYLLPFSLQSPDFTFSFDSFFKNLQSRQIGTRSLLPSHCLDLFSLQDWKKLSLEKSKFYIQVTSGPEMNHYKMRLLDVLDLGFSVQIWFDNPKEYRELHKNWQGLYPGQIFLCFLPNKNFDHHFLLNFQLKSGLQVLFLPKHTSLDSHLNKEEVLWFRHALSEVSSEIEILILPQSLLKLNSEEIDFFHRLDYPSLEKMLMKKNKIFYFFMLLFRAIQFLKMSFLLDILKQLLFFLAKPTLQGFQVVVTLFGRKVIELMVSIKLLFVNMYWAIRRAVSILKDQYWEFHRNPYQKILERKQNLVEQFRKWFWTGYRFVYDGVVALYFTSKKLPGDLRLVAIRMFYSIRSALQWTPILCHRLWTRFFWTIAWVYYLPPRIYGLCVVWMWSLHRGPFQQFLSLMLYLRGIPDYLYGAMIHFFWQLHRGPYQWFWRIKAWVFYWSSRLYWSWYSAYHSFLGRVAYFKGYLHSARNYFYWQVLHRLWYKLRFPFFKVYWFLSFQVKKRVLKKAKMS